MKQAKQTQKPDKDSNAIPILLQACERRLARIEKMTGLRERHGPEVLGYYPDRWL